MTTITREQLHERARRKVKELEFAITQSAFTSIRDGLNDELELARIALASLEVAPVGEVSEKRHGLVMDGTVDLGGKSTYRIIKGEKAMKRLPLGTKFYIAPPAPVVPEKMNFSTACNFVQINGMAKEDRATLAMRTWNAAIEKFKEMNKCL